LRIANRTIQLVQPVDPDRLLDDPDVAQLNRNDDYMPYWAYLWPGAFLLADVVGKQQWQGQATLEIGCGLGLAGLVGIAQGLHVHFTDYDLAPLAFIDKSATANGFTEDQYSTGLLDWRVLPQTTYPLILGADVLYERKLVPLVADVLAKMLAPGGQAWIADPYRVAAEGFAAECGSRGLTCVKVPIEAHSDDLGPLRGTLHKIIR
jgi:predicted nicotinamide N-methyase